MSAGSGIPEEENPFILQINQTRGDGESTMGPVVRARVSEAVALSLSNEYGSIFDSNNDNILGKGAAAGYAAAKNLGFKGTDKEYTSMTHFGTTQMWKGSSNGGFSFELLFVAKTDPVTEVRDNVIKLYKMCVPSLSKFTMIRPPTVTLSIGRMLRLENFYITNVAFTQSMKLVRTEPGKGRPLPMKAEGVIEVIPKMMLTDEIIGKIFP